MTSDEKTPNEQPTDADTVRDPGLADSMRSVRAVGENRTGNGSDES